MKKVLTFVTVLLFVFALAGCTSDDGVVTIGANIYTFNDNFMNGVVRPELESYAQELGVEIDIVDSEGSQATLNNQVDTFISKGVDVLVINLVDPAAAGTIIDKAKDADIPLILFNKEATVSGVMDTYDKVWYVGTDSAEAGIIQGEMMVADWQANADWDLNGDGKVQYVLLKGEPGHPDAEARTVEAVKAFTDAGIEVEELAIQPSTTWSTTEAGDTMAAWLTTAYADEIELVISNNDGMAFGAIQAMTNASYDIPIYGVDALEEALAKIGTGDLNGTVLNDGVNQARATLDLAVNAANGVDVLDGTDWVLDSETETKAVRVSYVAVTADNYEDFQ
ncbi:MAG: galactose/glucose ABC transporter substrate-binding protein MglB [Candidatus Izimaplasma sp.]|nr:galactose/glucose ABC transporter substrate-binding protein MglB [Candidatus Izimaplasma bacterium]